jgi:VWFA-related protein
MSLRLPGSTLLSPVLAFVFAASLCAQSASPVGSPQQPVAAPAPRAAATQLSPSIPELAEGRIKLDVVVTDPSGKPVTGLERKDFSLLDNGQKSQILSFHAFDGISARPDPPVEVILVIDTIRHTPDEIHDLQDAVEKFLRENGGHLAQPVSVYRLALESMSVGSLSVTPRPSTDGNALADELSRKDGLIKTLLDQDDDKPESNSTHFGQYFDQSANLHPQRPQHRSLVTLKALGSIVLEERRAPGRKLLVWLGYGAPEESDYLNDLGSFNQLETRFDWITEFSTRIREARISLCGVTFWKSPDRRFPYERFLTGVQSGAESSYFNLGLEVLAMQSGGRVLAKPNNDFAPLIDQCVKDASAFYTLSFEPAHTDHVDEYHDLKVQVSKPDLVTRTNAGYYDQPVFYYEPYVPSQRVTVQQLEQALDKVHGVKDDKLAQQLSDMELTECLSSARLASLKARVSGTKSWAALVAVADASAFLDPPPSEVPSRPPPDLAAQRLMQSRAIDYLLQTIPKLSDFFATRTTMHYRELPIHEKQAWKSVFGDRSLRWAGSSRADVLYRNGLEVVDYVKGSKREKGAVRFNTKGVFGPILRAAILDSARVDWDWNRWEQGAEGLRAVFRLRVPKQESHYQLESCGLLDAVDGTGAFELLTGYHGEITTDAESGAILRLSLEADLEPNLPVLRSGIVVEYGPVTIAGTTHLCLVRSISISRVRTIFDLHEWDHDFRVYGPFETMMDDVDFGGYHMFRGQMRILTGFDEVPEGKNPGPGSAPLPAAVPATPKNQ